MIFFCLSLKQTSTIFINLNRHRSKRETAKNSLYVEFLAVIDSGVFSYFQSLYGSNVVPSQINDYINIYFSQLINGVTIKINARI